MKQLVKLVMLMNQLMVKGVCSVRVCVRACVRVVCVRVSVCVCVCVLSMHVRTYACTYAHTHAHYCSSPLLAVSLTDVQDIEDPLNKVEAGLVGGDIPLQSVHIKAKLIGLVAQVITTSPHIRTLHITLQVVVYQAYK